MSKKLLFLIIWLTHIIYPSEEAVGILAEKNENTHEALAQFGFTGCKATISCYKCCVGELEGKSEIDTTCKKDYKNWRNAQNDKPCGCPEE